MPPRLRHCMRGVCRHHATVHSDGKAPAGDDPQVRRPAWESQALYSAHTEEVHDG